jgi:hypothetical protein
VEKTFSVDGRQVFHRYRLAAITALAIIAAGCGSSAVGGSTTGGGGDPSTTATLPQAHPQAIEPTAGQQAQAVTPQDPIGDPNAHAMPLSEVRHLLVLQHVAVQRSDTSYIDPLQYVTVWERTDQGVDAQLPVGAPILAPCKIKILAIEPDWYAGQPLVYFELLQGQQAGQVQYVAEEITDIAPPGSILQQGQTIAKYAAHGTAIEYGWSTLNGITLAKATTGYEEGEITPAGTYMRNWLNALGANAGPWPPK